MFVDIGFFLPMFWNIRGQCVENANEVHFNKGNSFRRLILQIFKILTILEIQWLPCVCKQDSSWSIYRFVKFDQDTYSYNKWEVVTLETFIWLRAVECHVDCIPATIIYHVSAKRLYLNWVNEQDRLISQHMMISS